MITRIIIRKVCCKQRTILRQDYLLKTRQPQLYFRQSITKSVRSRRIYSYSASQKITQHFNKHASSLPHSQWPNSETRRNHIKLFHDPLSQLFNELLSMNLRFEFVTANPFSKPEAVCNISYHVYAPFLWSGFPNPKIKG